MIRRRWGLTTLAVIASWGLAACSSDDTEGPATVDAADAYTAAIRWFAESLPQPSTTDGETPPPTVVFVAPADGAPIDAQAQADVTANLVDMKDQIDVRFADVRDDALDLDVEGEPVKDDGALLLVGQVDEAPPPVEVSIIVYLDADNESIYTMRVVSKGGSEFDVTAVTELELS